MTPYARRRRLAPLVYLFTVLLALPPGLMPAALAVTNRRINTLSRDTKLETFRNPQFSTAGSNRFLGTMGPQALVGSGGDDFSNPDSRGYGGVAEPVAHWISYKGRLEWTDNDLMLPGVGLPLIFQRIYRGSVSSYDGPLGMEWEFNWNKRIQYDASGTPTRAWFHELGRREDYVLSGGAYTSPIGRYDVLTRTATPEYWRTDREGLKEVYEQEPADGTWFRLRTVTDLNGNRVTFQYDGNSLLTKVKDTLDQEATLSWDGNDRITRIADHTSREWLYGYDASGRLTSVRTPVVDEAGTDDDYTSGKTTTYRYDSSGRLTEVLRPEDSGTGTWVWAYDGSGRITKETRAGNDITLAFDDGNDNVTVTDRESNVVVYWYDDSHEGNLITKRRVYYDASNFYETSYAYDAAGNVTVVIFPLGNRVLYTFDGSGNVVTVQMKKDATDGTPITWVYTWATSARLSTLRDPNGNTWDYDYDASSNLVTQTAPAVSWPNSSHGTIRHIWLYNSRGQVTRHTDPVGTHTDTSYTTVNGQSAYPDVVARDPGGLNVTTDYAYDGRGNVTGVKDGNNATTTYVVNALNQVILAVEPGSVSRKTHYDANDRVTRTEVSNDTTVGNSWFVVDHDYDTQDNLTRVRQDLTDASRITTTYAYDDNDRLTKVTTPEGNETVTSYEVRDLVAAVTRKAASSSDDAITSTTFDAIGNRLSLSNPSGHATVYAYDGYDRLTRVTQPEGNSSRQEYDANGNVITRQQYSAGNTKLTETVYSFDQANRLYQTDRLAKKADLSTNLGDGLQTVTTYLDEAGRVLEHGGDACGCSLWVHVYDALGREVTRKDPMGATDATRNLVLTEYDRNGNVTRTTRKDRTQDSGIEGDRDLVTEMVYDARNRVLTRKERLDGSTTMDTVYFYGLRDQVTRVVDGNGDERRTEHNEQLWTTQEAAEAGATDPTTEFTYDNDGRLVTYRAKNATTGDQDTIYTYDRLGRVITTLWPPNPTTAEDTIQTYDKAGNRISTTDPNGTVVVCAYDQNNRLTSRTMSLASNVVGATSHTFTYDGADRMASADSSEGGGFSSAIDFTYNTLGRLETETQILDGYASGAGRTITYTYDVEGNRTSTTYPVSGIVVKFERDALDRVSRISRHASELVAYTFNGSRPIKRAFGESYQTYLYDGYGRLTDTHAKDTDTGNTLVRFTYGFDKSHQITWWDQYYYDDVQNTRLTTDSEDRGDQFKYDGAKRLVSVLRGVDPAYVTGDFVANLTASPQRYREFVKSPYDQTGNRTTRTVDDGSSPVDTVYVHDKANQISLEGGSAVSHNASGNFTGTSNSHRYTWNNQFGQLIVAGSPAVTHTWHYDALNRRIQNDNSSTPTRTVRFYYDGQQMVEQVEWNGTAESARKQYYFGERIDDLLLYVNVVPNPDAFWYAHNDHLGSVQVLVDENGAIQEGYRYNEWGATTVVDSGFAKLNTLLAPSGNAYRYTGREQYTSFGSVGDDWYYYRARAYRPEWGRFSTRDPLSYVDGANAFLYVRNDPIANLDPMGLACGNWLTDWAIPDFEWGYCCEAHDECYDNGGPPTMDPSMLGTPAAKAKCDALFIQCVMLAGGAGWAATYGVAVHLGGGMTFNWAYRAPPEFYNYPGVKAWGESPL